VALEKSHFNSAHFQNIAQPLKKKSQLVHIEQRLVMTFSRKFLKNVD